MLKDGGPCSYPLLDSWLTEAEPHIEAVILMPNGLFVALTIHKEATLLELKDEKQSYVFTGVNELTSEREEFADERRKLCDVRAFKSLFRLVERKLEKPECACNAHIGNLIGKGLGSFDSLNIEEVSEFRRSMNHFCRQLADERADWPPLEQLKYRYPVRVDRRWDHIVPMHLRHRLTADSTFTVHIFSESGVTLPVNIGIFDTPRDLLLTVMQVPASQPLCDHGMENLVFKVLGKEEYLLEELPLMQYKYIEEKISAGSPPQLGIIPVSDIETDHDLVYSSIEECLGSACCRRGAPQHRSVSPAVSAWSITEHFIVHILAAKDINADLGAKIGVKAGLFHGQEPLCQTVITPDATLENNACHWGFDLHFEIAVCDIPRSARLCIVLFEVTRSAKYQRIRRKLGPDSYASPLAWVNATVYDFRGHLRSGYLRLAMWTYAEDLHAEDVDMLNPLGTVVANPDPGRPSVITISFPKYSAVHSVQYPQLAEILECAATCMNQGTEGAQRAQGHASKSHLRQLLQISEQDPLAPLHEQDRQLLWFLRLDCKEVPRTLPKLLQSLRWADHRDVAQMQALLQAWMPLKPEDALELLDYSYPDNFVRSFAVRCLEEMSDEELSLYLLQLVQALKHESYLECDLAKFLVKRALRNRHIGHQMFWLLRCEMHVPALSIKFGLIVEAYCHGAPEHKDALLRQTEALYKLRTVTEKIQWELNKKKECREKVLGEMREHVSKDVFQSTFHDLCSPLDPRHVLKQIRPESCRIMDSKMKPLWLTFENADPNTDDIMIIYKYGDDLRQDMLTLQIIGIMDKLWKDEGYDFRMVPYQCLSTDLNMGLIEVVQNANTIANIQKMKNFSATSAFKKGSLLAWLKDMNTTEESLKKAIENFTLSCAGYCVATYVLGVADRHSDNIMIKSNGELFHIDYGHILGKFKEKFGIRRERVPFVLTNDFVHVITYGDKHKSEAFCRFQEYCEEAFLILRRQGALIISLFAMMLTTGMPELTSEKDLDYLRETLVLDVSEADALQHFRAKFDEALRNSWTTSINWFAHNIAKDNK
ncbi:phosphatidylinositol 4,5-bisphosphate 3-kinase catalytic subunit beta isoform-like isoform X2 [Ornithodoros turicata]|uniref:phosphatidylinositol 4,5-bisphosphate 3-kinase catalytic subunit beta isoform-like isoform X2 n=1 Tax=Ornithodoros turicata TaxID=34597 RepID=UPI0031393FC7